LGPEHVPAGLERVWASGADDDYNERESEGEAEGHREGEASHGGKDRDKHPDGDGHDGHMTPARGGTPSLTERPRRKWSNLFHSSSKKDDK
jgi:hypothetical protein